MSEQAVRHGARADHLNQLARARSGDGARKVPYPIGIRELVLTRKRRLSPSMVRLTLGGPQAAGFESHVPDEHIRLIFPDPESGELRLPTRDGLALDWPRPHPISRVYTVRRHDPAAGEVDVDVVLDPGGLAAEWASHASIGDRIHVAGPPGGVVVPHRYDRYMLAGDLTALPAIARRLEGCTAAAPQTLAARSSRRSRRSASLRASRSTSGSPARQAPWHRYAAGLATSCASPQPTARSPATGSAE
jgi:NADPH-dependent ferric siderophore reductase